MRKIIVIIIILASACFLGFQSSDVLMVKSFFQFDSAEFIPNEILVEFKPHIPKQNYYPLAKSMGHKVKRVLKFSPYAVFDIKTTSTKNALKGIRKNSNVLSANVNSLFHINWVPNDPLYSFQWHLNKINMEMAWEDGQAQKGQGILIGLIDTGVAYENYDIYQIAPDLTGSNFIPGYDFVNDDSHANDDESHGTHVCGTIAQTTNNSVGVAGVSYQATVMPVKVLANDGSGTADWLVDALYFCADQGCHVVNMSLSWPNGYDPGTIVHNAIKYAYSRGVVLVASSGNDYNNVVNYPAAYQEVISVGATDYGDVRPSYSNYGADLEIVAPGGDLSVDKNGDSYGDGVLQQTFDRSLTNFNYYFYDGTSMACPHMTGLAALLLAKKVKGISGLREVVHNNAVDLGSTGWDQEYGYGRIDAKAALDDVIPEGLERLIYSSNHSQNITRAMSGNFVHIAWNEGNKIYYKRNISNGMNGYWESPAALTNWGQVYPGNNPIGMASFGNNVHIVMSWRPSGSDYYEILYRRSVNNGLNFEPWTKLCNTGVHSIQPSISVFRDNIYVAWAEYNSGGYEICFRYNSNNGDSSSWSTISSITGSSGNSTLPILASQENYVYLAWQDSDPGNKEIFFKRNINFGASGSWSYDVRITNNSGDSSFPDIAAVGKFVHLVWSDTSPGNGEIFYKKNINYGAESSWSTADRLTNNPGASGKPSIDAWGGRVSITWHDNNPGNWEVFIKESIDFGESWTDAVRMTYNLGSSLNSKVDAVNNLIFWDDDNPGNKEIFVK